MGAEGALAADDVPGDVLGERLDVQRLSSHHRLDCLFKELSEARHVGALLAVGEIDGALDLRGHHRLAPFVPHAYRLLHAGHARAGEREPHLGRRGLEIVRDAGDLRHAVTLAAPWQTTFPVWSRSHATTCARRSRRCRASRRRCSGSRSWKSEKRIRYLGLIDAASAELVVLLDLLSLAARIEGGRYEPIVRETDSLELAPEGATGTGATVKVDPDAVATALGVAGACGRSPRRRRGLDDGGRAAHLDRAGGR